MKNEKTYQYYLRDLGPLVIEIAEKAKKRYKKDSSEFEIGYLMACYAIASLIKDQAKAFEFDDKDIGMEGYNVDSLIFDKKKKKPVGSKNSSAK
jgi:hypothetical protein